MYNTCIIEHYAATQTNEDSFCIIMEKSLYVVVFFKKQGTEECIEHTVIVENVFS